MLEQEYEDDSLNCPCIVLLGDRKVGKTSLYKRFFEKKFLEELEATIVEDKYENVVEVEHTSKKYISWIHQENILMMKVCYLIGLKEVIVLF